MSWLRNGQVSLVALAVSAAMGLAACGGAESDRDSGKKTTDAQEVNFKRAISADAAGAGYSLPKFSAIVGADEELSFEEANAALRAIYADDEYNKYVAANTPKESTFDLDGTTGLSDAERAKYNEAAALVAVDAQVYVDGLNYSVVAQFANQNELIAAFDTNGDGKVVAADFGITPPADVTGINLAALAGDLSNLYVRGTITTWDGGAALLDTNKFVKTGDATYEYDYVSEVEGYGEFKIADGAWTGSTNCGTAEAVLVTGAETASQTSAGYTGECGPTSPNVRVYFYKGNYRFKVDFSTADAPKFWVIKNAGSAGSVIPAPVIALKAAVKDSATFKAAAGEDNLLSFVEAKAQSPELTNLQFLSLDQNLDLSLSADELGITLIAPVTVDCGTKVDSDNDNVYIIGGFTRVGADAWTFGDKCKLTKSNTTYSLGLDLPGNPNEAIEFKFANAGWAGPVNCAGDTTLTLGSSFTGVCGGDSPNLKVVIPEAGYYKFDLNLADAANPVITVAKSSKTVACEGELPDAASDGKEVNDGNPMYLRGNLTDPEWGVVPAFQFAYKGNGTYQIRFTPTKADSQFKVASDADNWAPAFSLGAAVALNTEVDVATSNSENSTLSGLSTTGVYLATATLAGDAGKLKIVECK